MPKLTPELRADFLQWLRTGSFRGVRLGMTRAECVKRLGEPDEWIMGDSQATATIWRWDDLEFFFASDEDERLFQIQEGTLKTIFSDWQATIAALFGYGYDEEKHISSKELDELLLQLGMTYKNYLLCEKEGKQDQSIIKFAQLNFRFGLAGPPRKELIYMIEQGQYRQNLNLKELP